MKASSASSACVGVVWKKHSINIARNGLCSAGHPYVQTLVIANYKLTILV